MAAVHMPKLNECGRHFDCTKEIFAVIQWHAKQVIDGLAQPTKVHQPVHNAQPSVTLTAHLRLS
jgi:hypothetical protein